MVEKFENFYNDHIPRQQNAYADTLASLTASLALLVKATEKVLVYSCDLCCCKFALKDNRTPRRDLQVKEVLETSTSLEPKDCRFSYIDFILYDILHMTPKRQPSSEGKPLDSITMRLCKYCIADHMMESYSDTFHTKRHKRRSKSS